MAQTKETPKNTPVRKYRLSGVTLSVWENTTEEFGTNASMTIEKSFKKENGEWETSKTFFIKDLLSLKALINAAIDEYAVRKE